MMIGVGWIAAFLFGVIQTASRRQARTSLAICCVVAACGTVAGAVDPWPGETWGVSSNLTYLGPASPYPWTSNLSGAYWNPVTRRLWLANNSGGFTVLKEDVAGGFLNAGNYNPGGDLEGITQADPAADRVYLMVENAEDIRAYSTNGVAKETWDLTPTIGALANSGTEGIAFIPNVWLAASGFRDLNGNLYPSSVHGTNGLGGIMLVAVQGTSAANYGYVYAVDLKKDGTHTLVGRYKTSRNESCDLAFDASIGRLYINHNIDGNILEVTDLTSAPYGADRKFTTLREFQVPSGSNIEGFGLTPALTSSNTVGNQWCFFTDDNNADGALRWFKQLPSPISANAGNNQNAPVSTAVPVAPSVVVMDAFKNPLPGVAVTFAVTSGGGSCTAASTTTLTSGVATVGSWTLGPVAGLNTLSAAAVGFSGSPVTITAVGVDATAYPPGDVNGDTHVTGADSLLINQVLVGLRPSTSAVFNVTGFANGDVNQSSTVTGGDPLLINQTLVGLRTYLVTKIVPNVRTNIVPTPVTIYGLGFPTNTASAVTIGSPVNLTLTNVVVISREQINALVPAGGGIGTGTVNVTATPSNGVTSFGRFINQ